MRVALVTEFYYPHFGGVTEHVHNLARTLIESGHHAIIITSHMAAPGRPHEGIDCDPTYVHRIGTSRVVTARAPLPASPPETVSANGYGRS
jgi:glycosyltransferase involved in cell wall biosynthesis